jgi:hypothetical protein
MTLHSWAPVFSEVEISAGQTSLILSSHSSGLSQGGLFRTDSQKEIPFRPVILLQIEEGDSGRAEECAGQA